MKYSHRRGHGRPRTRTGGAIIEELAALVVIVPFLVFLIFASIEIASFLLAKNCLDEGARMAARGCAMAYHWPPYGTGQIPTGTMYSPDAQGDTVDPPTTSGATPSASPVVQGTSTTAAATSGQPQTANQAFSRIRFSKIITSNTQFQATYIPASVNDVTAPQYQNGHVTVTVSAQLSQLPLIDPLNLKSIFNPIVSSSSTYSL